MSAADDAAHVISLFAVDPIGTGGVCLRSPAHAPRDQWLTTLRDQLGPGIPVRRVPFNIPDGRLLGGLDLVATLKAGRPVAERGALADTDGGVIVLTMAERLNAQTAARLNAVLDTGRIALPREGVMIEHAARVGLVALDEGMDADECLPVAVLDRLAFTVDLTAFDMRTALIPFHTGSEVAEARVLYPEVQIDARLTEALCGTAIALGAGSPRVSILAVRVARIAAALAGRTAVIEEDAVLAGRLVLAPRATRTPQAEAEAPPESPEPPAEAQTAERPDSPDKPDQPNQPLEIEQQALEDLVLAATQAAIPAGLLARLQHDAHLRGARAAAGGKTGALRKSGARGRPCGVRPGNPSGDARLNVIETLRTAAPWQRLRGRDGARVRVLPEDFRVTRYQQRSPTLTIFTVDASGSAALNRLAEAKGAVELLLADCYVRRDQVAVIAFRGRKAEILLPPTRSLVRAKRSLAGLPGGGGTPLALALDAALALAELARRRGETPTLVVLTDGRANVARDGAPGRDRAHSEALVAARAIGLAGLAALFVDTSPRPNELARALSERMRAQYIALPYANARALNSVVRAATATRAGA